MNVAEALKQRKSTRAFLNKPVPQHLVEKVLNSARHAPSGTNTQPWQVAVVSGNSKQKLDAMLINAFLKTGEGKMDYQYYPEEWIEPYKSRRRATGLQLYSTLNIARDEKEKQKAQWLRNYTAFGAPTVLFFFMCNKMRTGSFMDYGMFLQSIMLAAVEEGLATCAQAALGQQPDLIKSFLGYPDDSTLICGMALGYEDSEALVNNYRTPRLEVSDFTRFFD